MSKTNERLTVGTGNFSMVIDEDVLAKMMLLKECSYMQEQIDEVIGKIIHIYQESSFEGDFLKSDEAMKILSLLHDIKRDYKFLTSIDIRQNETVE